MNGQTASEVDPLGHMTQSHERRQFGRRQTYLHAWISSPGRPRLPCIVRDISVGGALLELNLPPWLPYNFQLTIESTKFTSWCEVRHQSGTKMGVRFVDAAEIQANRGTSADFGSVTDGDSWMGDRKLPPGRTVR